MPSTTVNGYVFRLQNEKLLALSIAIEGIGSRVLKLGRDLPRPIREQVSDLFKQELSAIEATCACLCTVALAASNEAENWEMWADDTETDLTYFPHKGIETGGRAAPTAQRATKGHNPGPNPPADIAGKITVEKIGRIIKETFDAGYTEEDGKILSDTLQEIYTRIHPNAMNPAFPNLE